MNISSLPRRVQPTYALLVWAQWVLRWLNQARNLSYAFCHGPWRWERVRKNGYCHIPHWNLLVIAVARFGTALWQNHESFIMRIEIVSAPLSMYVFGSWWYSQWFWQKIWVQYTVPDPEVGQAAQKHALQQITEVLMQCEEIGMQCSVFTTWYRCQLKISLQSCVSTGRTIWKVRNFENHQSGSAHRFPNNKPLLRGRITRNKIK